MYATGETASAISQVCFSSSDLPSVRGLLHFYLLHFHIDLRLAFRHELRHRLTLVDKFSLANVLSRLE